MIDTLIMILTFFLIFDALSAERKEMIAILILYLVLLAWRDLSREERRST